MDISNLIIQAGALAAALIAVLHFKDFFRNVFSKLVNGIKLFMNGKNILQSCDIIKKELTPNGGNSIHDKLGKVTSMVASLVSMHEHFMYRDRGFYSLMDIPVFETDSKGSCVYANRAYCDLTQLSESQVYGSGWINAIAPEERDFVMSQWEHAVEQKRDFKQEYNYQNINGKIRVTCHATPVINNNKEILGWLGKVEPKKEKSK